MLPGEGLILVNERLVYIQDDQLENAVIKASYCSPECLKRWQTARLTASCSSLRIGAANHAS